jgi:ketosteroid isomerase-like protein
MSEENVETTQRSLRALDRRDRDAWLAERRQGCEVIPTADWPETEIRGRDAAWDFYVEVLDTFQQSSVSEDAEVVYAGPDSVLIHWQGNLRGRESGAEVGFDYWGVSTFRGGKIVRDHWFTDRAAALEAAGLSE